MPIRIRAMLVIILSNLLIISFSFAVGINYVRDNIEKSQETDLMTVSDIADHFISKEIEVLRLKADDVIRNLTLSGESEWSKILAKEETIYPEFIGMTVLDSNGKIIASAGAAPAGADVINDKYVKQAFTGSKILSSTIPSGDGVVFYLAAPLETTLTGKSDRILALTIPGLYFTRLTSTFVIWKTGHIFIDDEEGNIIANIRENWVLSRHNFIKAAETDAQYKGIASVIQRVIDGETGVGYFSLADIPRLCSFRPVKAPECSWFLGIIAPLPESPAKKLDSGLIIIAFVSFILNVFFAIVTSVFIEKPFKEIAVLKEEAEANSRYKSNFLANMSHEMRTPLNVIVGLTDLQMGNEKLPRELQEDLKKINSAGGLLLGIVNDVLDISKIEAGKMELMLVAYNTASVLNDIISLNMIRIEEKPIRFMIDISERLPCELYGDDLRVKQILNNLLSNAFKYTREGTVSLVVDSEREDEKNIILRMTISDTGIGIKPENISKLFTDYNQVDTKANRKIEGTGLGLAITKNLVDMIGGKISVESEYGKGTTFRVSLRQGFVNDKTLGAETVDNLRNFHYMEKRHAASSRINRPDLSYARVLVVDDFPTNLDVAAGLLRKYKMQVDCVSSGQQAVDIIKRGEPLYDTIFMDHMMPEMDGIEATRLIRSLNTEYAKNIPIISLTANALAGNEKMFLEQGFNAFLSKPINVFNLDLIVKKYVRDISREQGQESEGTS